jgi:excisionase family DNA binding protein
MAEEYLSTEGLSPLIKRTKPAIRNLVMRRQIPFRKPGGRLLFIRSEIEEWIRDAEGVSYEEIKKGKASVDGRGS